VAYAKIGAHLSYVPLHEAPTVVILCHPRAGFYTLPLDVYQRAVATEPHQVALGNGHYEIDECLVIRMIHTNHPERTISYRFEERPTGKVFVFLTDHENTAGIGLELKQHVAGADVLVVDCQYTDDFYPQRIGFGHGTPYYAALLAQVGRVKRLGITHHDPMSTDKDVQEMERLTVQASIDLHRSDARVFTARDYLSIKI
jgi:ribonuclease BN (tRNA processing enzyme)